jgi:two-component system chemotaxis response regulator CheB
MDLEHRFVAEIKMLSRVSVITHLLGKTKTRKSAESTGTRPQTKGDRAVGIVCSTGGPNALKKILSMLPADIPAGTVIVQHISEGFDRELTHWLGENSDLKIKQTVDGEVIEPGVGYVCPAGRHTLIGEGGLLTLDDSPPLECFRPSGDLMLSTLARTYGAGAIGVILTGMGHDGARGIKAVKDAGGRTIAQDKDTSLIFGMPRAAIELGVVDKVMPLEHISEQIIESLCSPWVR